MQNITALAAGCLAALGIAFLRISLPIPSFGALPAILGLLPGVAHLLFAVRRAAPVPEKFLRPVAAISAVLAPPALAALHYLTGSFGVIPQDSSATAFIASAAVAFLGFGLPITLLGDLRITALPEPDRRFSVGAPILAAAGCTLIHTLLSVTDARIAFAAAALAPTSLLLLRPPAPQPAASATAAADPPGAGLRLLSRLLWLPLMAAGTTAGLLAIHRILLHEALPTEAFTSWLLPAIVAAFALGAAAASSPRLAGRSLIIVLPSALYAASLATGLWLHESDFFPATYIAFYDGASTASPLGWGVTLLILLPAFFWGAVSIDALPLRPGSGGRFRWLPLPVGVLVGILFFTIGRVNDLQTVVVTMLTLALPAATRHPLAALLRRRRQPAPDAAPTRHARRGRAPGRSATSLVARLEPWGSILLVLTTAGLLLAASFVHLDRFPNLLDPIRFRIASEEQAPGGTMSFLQSRDDDDPNHVTMWNHTRVLTQSLAHARPVLFRYGHIPMLLHPHPRRVLVLGLGSRMALEAVAMHQPERITCVEPSDALARLRDPRSTLYSPDTILSRVQLVIDRPPAFLARNRDRQDVIISAEPLATPLPDAAVFTPAYYASVAASLNDGGIFAQWLPLASMPGETVKAVVTAITSVFPETEAWVCGMDPETAMLGIMASATPFDAGMTGRFDALLQRRTLDLHLATLGLSAVIALPAEFAMDRAALQAWAAGSAPLSLWSPHSRLTMDGASAAPTLRSILTARSAIPERLLAGMPDSLRARVQAQRDARPVVLTAAEAASAGDDAQAATVLFDVLRNQPWQFEARTLLAEVLHRRASADIGQQKFQDAILVCNQILRIAPVTTGVLRIMMICGMKLNDPGTASLAITGIRALRTNSTAYQDNRASILAQEGKGEDALLIFQSAIALNPLREDVYCNQASLEYSMGRRWEAMHTLEEAIKASYYPAKAYYMQGLINLDARRPQLALDSFRNFLRTSAPNDPRRAEVLQNMATLEAQGGK